MKAAKSNVNVQIALPWPFSRDGIGPPAPYSSQVTSFPETSKAAICRQKRIEMRLGQRRVSGFAMPDIAESRAPVIAQDRGRARQARPYDRDGQAIRGHGREIDAGAAELMLAQRITFGTVPS